jgi:NADPH-dependent curcumin reductase CurA
LLNSAERAPVCGLIAHYNETRLPEGPDRSPVPMRILLSKSNRMQGFLILEDYGHRYLEFAKDLSHWVGVGKIKVHEDFVDGLEHVPLAFPAQLECKNLGKLIVCVAQD